MALLTKKHSHYGTRRGNIVTEIKNIWQGNSLVASSDGTRFNLQHANSCIGVRHLLFELLISPMHQASCDNIKHGGMFPWMSLGPVNDLGHIMKGHCLFKHHWGSFALLHNICLPKWKWIRSRQRFMLYDSNCAGLIIGPY